MRFARNFLDRLRPHFEQGGKLEKLYPAYEMVDTFLFTPDEVTRGASHVRDALDLKRMMITVVAALGPCILMAMWNTGYQANLAFAAVSNPELTWQASLVETLGLALDPASHVSNAIHGAAYFIPVFLVCNIVGGFWEALFALIRKHEINEGFLVTGMLFPLTLPPTIPLWQVALGISFGVVLGKEVFGGTGRNFLNPALTARAFLYFAYPAQITGNVWTAGASPDGVSGATILGEIADVELAPAALESFDWMTAFLGTTPGSMGETSALACVIGAVVLIATGVGSWRIMAGVVIGTLAFSGLLYGIGSDTNYLFRVPPYWHLVIGGFAFGTVFMATDPVSAAMTTLGKWIYGILIGVMTILVRVVNPAFPEGIMLAILFGNVFAPVIDHYVVKANIKRRLARTQA